MSGLCTTLLFIFRLLTLRSRGFWYSIDYRRTLDRGTGRGRGRETRCARTIIIPLEQSTRRVIIGGLLNFFDLLTLLFTQSDEMLLYVKIVFSVTY